MKGIIKVGELTVIVLMISLGSSVDMLAANPSCDPHYNIFRTNVERSYSITDHLIVNVEQDGSIQLRLSEYQFSIESNEKSINLQHIANYPDLNTSAWTKEWKSSDLPIFCRAEHLIQKQSGIAFRFRLGSVDYVNALEGK